MKPSPGPPKVSHFAKPVLPWQRALVGIIVLAIGIFLSGLCLFALIHARLTHRATSMTFFVSLAGLLLVGFCFLVLGMRLVTGRSRHRDSLLSRPLWFVMAAVFAACAVWMSTIPRVWHDPVPFLSCTFLAIACLGVALRPRTTDRADVEDAPGERP